METNDQQLINNMRKEDVLQGDEYDINGVKWKVVAFGEVTDGEHHYISSEEFNKRKKETI